jgi:hypothetical protein
MKQNLITQQHGNHMVVNRMLMDFTHITAQHRKVGCHAFVHPEQRTAQSKTHASRRTVLQRLCRFSSGGRSCKSGKNLNRKEILAAICSYKEFLSIALDPKADKGDGQKFQFI